MGNTYNKLIDAAEAFRVLSDYYHHRTETQADALREALDRVPEAVVRCEDCVHCADDCVDTEFGAMQTFTCDLFGEYGVNIMSWHYCSYGERRSNEDMR